MSKESESSDYDLDRPIDTVILSQRVRHYLMFNQIRWGQFARLVLGVGQARLSTLLGNPQPWPQLSRRLRSLYARMEEWMDTRATYGNNPYMRLAKPMPIGGRGRNRNGLRGRGGRFRSGRAAGQRGKRKLRSLFVYDEGLRTSEEQSAVEYIVGLEDEQVSTSMRGEDYRDLEEMMMCDNQVTAQSASAEMDVFYCDYGEEDEEEEERGGDDLHLHAFAEVDLTGLELRVDEATPLASLSSAGWLIDDLELLAAYEGEQLGDLPRLANLDLEEFMPPVQQPNKQIQEVADMADEWRYAENLLDLTVAQADLYQPAQSAAGQNSFPDIDNNKILGAEACEKGDEATLGVTSPLVDCLQDPRMDWEAEYDTTAASSLLAQPDMAPASPSGYGTLEAGTAVAWSTINVESEAVASAWSNMYAQSGGSGAEEEESNIHTGSEAGTATWSTTHADLEAGAANWANMHSESESGADVAAWSNMSKESETGAADWSLMQSDPIGNYPTSDMAASMSGPLPSFSSLLSLPQPGMGEEFAQFSNNSDSNVLEDFSTHASFEPTPIGYSSTVFQEADGLNPEVWDIATAMGFH